MKSRLIIFFGILGLVITGPKAAAKDTNGQVCKSLVMRVDHQDLSSACFVLERDKNNRLFPSSVELKRLDQTVEIIPLTNQNVAIHNGRFLVQNYYEFQGEGHLFKIHGTFDKMLNTPLSFSINYFEDGHNQYFDIISEYRSYSGSTGEHCRVNCK